MSKLDKERFSKFDKVLKRGIATLQVSGSLAYEFMEIVGITASLYDMLDISYIAQTSETFLDDLTEKEKEVLKEAVEETEKSSQSLIDDFEKLIKERKDNAEEIFESINKQIERVTPKVELIEGS